MNIEINEFDGKVVYGKKRIDTGINIACFMTSCRLTVFFLTMDFNFLLNIIFRYWLSRSHLGVGANLG